MRIQVCETAGTEPPQTLGSQHRTTNVRSTSPYAAALDVSQSIRKTPTTEMLISAKLWDCILGNHVTRRMVYWVPPAALEYQDYSFRRSPNESSVALRGPVANYSVTTEYKTGGRLEKGGQFPPSGAIRAFPSLHRLDKARRCHCSHCSPVTPNPPRNTNSGQWSR